MANYELLQESVSDYIFDQTVGLLVQEGEDLKISKIFTEAKKEWKKSTKEIKKAWSNKEYDKAAEECDKLIKYLNDMETEVNDIKDDAWTIIGGVLSQGLLTVFKAFLISIPTFGIGTFIPVVKDVLDIVIGVTKQWKEEGEFTPEMINTRRDKIKGLFSEMTQMVKNYKKNIEAEAKKAKEEEKKEEKPVKESATVEEVKLHIFESCHAGDISQEERNALLAILEK